MKQTSTQTRFRQRVPRDNARTGARRHRGEFLSPPTSTDEYGQPGAYVSVATRDISIRTVTGIEKYRSMQDVTDTTHWVNVRYDSTLANVSPKYRILFGTRTFEITAVMNIGETNRELDIMCKEVQ